MVHRNGRRDGFNRKAWSWWLVPQQQGHEASHGLFIARLGAFVSKLLTAVLPLHRTGLPRLVPAPITDGIA